LRGLTALEDGGSVLGRHISGVDDVLDADRDAIERTDTLALAARRVRGARLGQGMLAVEMGEGLHIGLALSNAVQTRRDQLFRRCRPIADGLRGLGCRQLCQRAHITLNVCAGIPRNIASASVDIEDYHARPCNGNSVRATGWREA